MKRVLACSLLLFGCEPALVDQTYLITAPRVIAVTTEPPEAPPGGSVGFRAWVATPGGPDDAASLRWSTCDEPRAFSQNQAINPDCFTTLSQAPLTSTTAGLTLTSDICRRFGPDAPADGVRPRDPDTTGGYYQPEGVELGTVNTYAFVRLSCAPAGVSFDVFQAYQQQAKPNQNPRFTVSADGHDFAAPLSAGATLHLAADWTQTPEETFVLIDPSTAQLVSQVEHYDVTWFVTAGTLTPARSQSGVGEWTLPEAPGAGTLWAVLRDSRGGVAVQVVPVSWK